MLDRYTLQLWGKKYVCILGMVLRRQSQYECLVPHHVLFSYEVRVLPKYFIGSGCFHMATIVNRFEDCSVGVQEGIDLSPRPHCILKANLNRSKALFSIVFG